jgi:hypothetical protein
VEEAPAAPKPAPESSHALVLADVSQPLVPEEDAWLIWTRITQEHGRAMLLGFSGLLLVAAGVLRLARWRNRQRSRSMWLLPEVETTPRFGGAHCGSGGVWIKYGS